MKFSKLFLILFLIIILLNITNCSANELDNSSISLNDNDLNLNQISDDESEITINNDDSDLNQISDGESEITIDEIGSDLEKSTEDVITVDDWDDLQYYAYKSDKNYVVKLKENTAYYPKIVSSVSNQIVVRNNLTVLGSPGAYIGDESPNSQSIQYNLISTTYDSGVSIFLQDITFKNIFSKNTACTLIEMSGNSNNTIKNCNFENINISYGKSTLVHIVLGDCMVDNCSFINITQGYGTVSAYCPMDTPQKLCTSARLKVFNSYFENNYATSEPGCINNCGVLVAYNTTFYNNRASVWAGAIHTHSGANSTIINCNFINNLAGWNGGAIYTYSYLQIFNSTFRGNNCTTNNGGGAIGACTYKTSPYIYIENSLFENNENLCWGLDELSTTGTGRGGAISIMDAGSLKVYNTTFIKNSASIGPAICAIVDPAYGSPDVELSGNRFINHTRVDDVVVINLDGSYSALHDNYYLNNSIKYSQFALSILEVDDEDMTFEVQSVLKNPNYYDSDILDKCEYDVFVDGKFFKKITGSRFTLNFEEVKTYNVYVVASISNKKSNTLSITISKKFVYVSKEIGNDSNDGLTRNTPVYSLKKAIELARFTQNILIMDGEFREENLLVDYDLNIRGQNDARIGGFNSLNNIFEVNNAKLSIKKVIFTNITGADDSKVIHSNGLLIIDNCDFENNEFIKLVEAKEINIKNTIFKNNILSIESINLTVDNVSFINNSAKNYSLLKSKDTSINWTITNSIFDGNHAVSFYIDSSTILNVYSSIFQNNYNALVFKASHQSSINIKNSVILNNSNSNSGQMFIGETNNIDCNYNWWGNTFKDIHALPNLSQSIVLDNWLILNISADSNVLEYGQTTNVKFELNNLITKNGIISKYLDYQLPKLKFSLVLNNITLNKDEVILENGVSKNTLTLNSTNDGYLLTRYNNICLKTDFEFIKTIPNVNIKVNDILIGQNATIEISLPKTVTGNVTIRMANRTETKLIEKSTLKFIIPNLEVNSYDVEFIYSGDNRYASIINHTSFEVKKYDSQIQIQIPKFELYEDVVLTFTLPEDAKGNLTLNINGNYSIIYLNNSKATYTIKNITRGDWKVNVTYNGDEKYNVSYKYVKFGAYKPNSTIIVNVLDTKYGEDAIIEITLADDATGNLTVKIDDVIQNKVLQNAYVSFNFTNLDAGLKKVQINYTGDKNYNEVSYVAYFNIEKTTIDFIISASNINEGNDAVVTLSILSGTSGTFTLKCENIRETVVIPKTGLVTWHIPDLSIGNHFVSAVFNGNENYYIAKNNVTFNVSPWNIPQWSNDGENIKNTGKSPYQSNVNGEVLWSVEIGDEIIGNFVIDDNGNIIFIAESGIYSYDKNGNYNWKFNSSIFNPFTGLSVNREVVISPVSGDTLYLINQTSGEKYGFSNIYQGSSVFSPVTDENGNIYITSEYQHIQNSYNLVIVPYKQWYDGDLPIEISLGKSTPTTAPVIVNENMVCVCCEDGLKLIDISENKVVTINTNIITHIRPVSSNGIIYALTQDSLIALDTDNNQIFNHKINETSFKYFVLDDDNGFAYAIDLTGKLYQFDLTNDGVEKVLSNLIITTGLLIGNNGDLYFGCNDKFYALNSDGEILWKSILKTNLSGTPVMDKDGVIYISGYQNLYALSNTALKNPDLSIDIENQSEFGIIINILLNPEVTGKINVSYNNQTYLLDIIDGKAALNISTAGEYVLNVSYSGNQRFHSKWSMISFNLSKIKLNNSDINIFMHSNGLNGKIEVNLAADSMGKLIVLIDGNKFLESDDLRSIIELPKLSSGLHTISVNYGGDSKYCPLTVTKTVNIDYIPKISGNRDLTMDYGSSAIYKVRVYGTNGNIVIGEFIIFKINGKSFKVKTDKNGFASLKITEIPKNYVITVEYGKIKVSNKITVKQILKANNIKIKKSSKKLTLKATLKSSKGKAIKNKKITFKFNGKTYKAKTNSKGIAKVVLKKSIIKKLKVNKKYQLKIVYVKDVIKKIVSVKK